MDNKEFNELINRIKNGDASAEAVFKNLCNVQENEIPEQLIERKNQRFTIYSYNSGKEFVFNSFDQFKNKLDKIFNHAGYGACTDDRKVDKNGFRPNFKEIPCGKNNAEDAKKLIIDTIINCSKDAKFADFRTIQIFNNRDEVVYEISYDNDIILNRQKYLEIFDCKLKFDNNQVELCTFVINKLNDIVTEDIEKMMIDKYQKSPEIKDFLKLKITY